MATTSWNDELKARSKFELPTPTAHFYQTYPACGINWALGLFFTTYKVTVEGTYDGKDQSGTYNAGSVWNKQNGEWQAIFHTNIKEAPTGG